MKRNPKLVAQIEVVRCENMIKVAVRDNWTTEQRQQWEGALERAKVQYNKYL